MKKARPAKIRVKLEDQSPANVLEATKPVQVKLVPGERQFLDALVRRKLYESRSGALRAGLGLLMTKHRVDPELEQVIERQRRYHRPRGGRAM